MKRLFLVIAMLSSATAFARRDGELDHGRTDDYRPVSSVASWKAAIRNVSVEELALRLEREYSLGKFSPETKAKIESTIALVREYQAKSGAGGGNAGTVVSAMVEVLNMMNGEPTGLDLHERIYNLKREAEAYKKQEIARKDQEWSEKREKEMNDPNFVGPVRPESRPRDEQDSKPVSLDEIADRFKSDN